MFLIFYSIIFSILPFKEGDVLVFNGNVIKNESLPTIKCTVTNEEAVAR